MIREFARRPSQHKRDELLSALTVCESEVLTLIALGLSNHEIAQRLVISDATAKTHVARILQKLGLRDRVHAVVAAYESGVIEVGAEGH